MWDEMGAGTAALYEGQGQEPQSGNTGADTQRTSGGCPHGYLRYRAHQNSSRAFNDYSQKTSEHYFTFFTFLTGRFSKYHHVFLFV